MKDQLCPKCGSFAMRLEPGALGKEDVYVCSVCGARVEATQITVPLNRDTMQRFPTGNDAQGESPLNPFMERKRQ